MATIKAIVVPSLKERSLPSRQAIPRIKLEDVEETKNKKPDFHPKILVNDEIGSQWRAVRNIPVGDSVGTQWGALPTNKTEMAEGTWIVDRYGLAELIEEPPVNPGKGRKIKKQSTTSSKVVGDKIKKRKRDERASDADLHPSLYTQSFEKSSGAVYEPQVWLNPAKSDNMVREEPTEEKLVVEEPEEVEGVKKTEAAKEMDAKK